MVPEHKPMCTCTASATTTDNKVFFEAKIVFRDHGMVYLAILADRSKI